MLKRKARSRLKHSHTQINKQFNLGRYLRLMVPHLASIDLRYFFFSLVLYAVLFIFFDRVSPESVANIPAYQAYLPFHFLMFIANFSLLVTFLRQQESFLLAWLIELVLFFKLQGFLITGPLVISLALMIICVEVILLLWQRLTHQQKSRITQPVSMRRRTNLHSRHKFKRAAR